MATVCRWQGRGLMPASRAASRPSRMQCCCVTHRQSGRWCLPTTLPGSSSVSTLRDHWPAKAAPGGSSHVVHACRAGSQHVAAAWQQPCPRCCWPLLQTADWQSLAHPRGCSAHHAAVPPAGSGAPCCTTLSRVLLRLPVSDQACCSTPAPGLHTAHVSAPAAAFLGANVQASHVQG